MWKLPWHRPIRLAIRNALAIEKPLAMGTHLAGTKRFLAAVSEQIKTVALVKVAALPVK